MKGQLEHEKISGILEALQGTEKARQSGVDQDEPNTVRTLDDVQRKLFGELDLILGARQGRTRAY